ncbi:hypothetical protein [Cellulomonas hominis]
MTAFAFWIVLALVAAAGVMVLAALSGDEGFSLSGFWRDLRGAWAHRREPRETDPVAEAEPVDVPLSEMFAQSSVADDGYLSVDELTDTIARAVPGHARRAS